MNALLMLVVMVMCFQFNPSPDSAVSHSKFYALEINGHCSPVIDHCIIHSSSIGQCRVLTSVLYLPFSEANADPNRILFAQLPDNWRRPQGGHAPRGFKMFATTCPHLAWGCQKPGRQLRTDLSGGC